MGTKRAFCNTFVRVTFLRLGLGVDMEGARLEALASLRAEIARLERGKPISEGPEALPFGVAAIDAQLPADGLLLGAMHELQAAGPDTETGAAPALFAAGILARRPGTVVWIGRETEVFAAGLLDAGLDPRRVVFVDAGKFGLLAMEEALGVADVAGVVCELEGRLDLVTSRRLQLAAEGSEVLGLLIRRSRRFDDPVLRQPSAAATRWRIGCAAVPGGAGACAGHPWAEPAAVAGWSCCGAEGVREDPGSWRGAMRRVVSLWLPYWPIDRLRRHDASLPADGPLVTRLHDGRRMVIAAACSAARELGLHAGMPVAHAQAMVPKLTVVDATPGDDAEALGRLAAWCLRLSPMTAPDQPDGVWIDVTGCTHFHGGERAMLDGLVEAPGRSGPAGQGGHRRHPGRGPRDGPLRREPGRGGGRRRRRRRRGAASGQGATPRRPDDRRAA